MKYKLNRPEITDERALKEIIRLVDSFEIAARALIESRRIHLPDEYYHALESPDEAVGMEFSAYELMHDAALDALVDMHSFDIRLGYMFKAADASGVGDFLAKAMPSKLASDRNRVLFEKYELPNLAMIAKMV